MSEQTLEEIRLEITKIAGKIRTAYGHEDWTSFSFYSGQMYGLVSKLYEAQAREESR